MIINHQHNHHHLGGGELRALGPDRMSIMVATELVRHCKAHREKCASSETLSNTAKHYQTWQKIIRNYCRHQKTLSDTAKHFQTATTQTEEYASSETLRNLAKHY